MSKYIIDYLKQASETWPDNIALVCDQKSVSYQQLDILSEQIAQGLRLQGVVQGDRIALYMDKSILAIASIYAVLKLACCYVPISLDSPELRIASIVKNCSIEYVLSEDELGKAKQISLEKMAVNSVAITRLVETAKLEKLTLLTSPEITGDEAAAILHTSGSTGAPKGAVITQKNLSVFISWAVSAFAITAEDRLLSHAPLQFDLSFFDLFAAVAAGATVVLASNADTTNAARMSQLVKQTDITIWQSVPSALTLQVLSRVSSPAQQSPQIMPKVRCVLFAGERLPRPTLLSIAVIFPEASFYNIYGCTETNNTFIYQLPNDITEAPDPLPLGQALAHIQYRIVDELGADVVLGKQGHLLVASDTVMAGYISLDRTGAIAYDNSNCSNGFYQTNDLVSAGGDGEIYFHGRLDNVIKSNGYRINLMAIEDYLRESEKFDEVAVICQPDELIGNRIIAFVKPKSGESCSILELKVLCAKTLPKYAIPHRFYISKQALPKGSTGKIDKQLVAEIEQ